MRYELFKIITTTIVNNNGKVSTPVIGYLLVDKFDYKVKYYNKHDAYKKVMAYGADNAEAKFRLYNNISIYYLKPTVGKVTDYLMIEMAVG